MFPLSAAFYSSAGVLLPPICAGRSWVSVLNSICNKDARIAHWKLDADAGRLCRATVLGVHAGLKTLYKA